MGYKSLVNDLVVYILWLGGLLVNFITVQSAFLTTVDVIIQCMNVAERGFLWKPMKPPKSAAVWLHVICL